MLTDGYIFAFFASIFIHKHIVYGKVHSKISGDHIEHFLQTYLKPVQIIKEPRNHFGIKISLSPLLLLIVLSISLHNCYNLLLNSNLKEGQTEKFPNHKIELELVINGIENSPSHTIAAPQRRYNIIRVHKKPAINYLRSGADQSSSSTPTSISTTTSPSTITNPHRDERNRPVFMADLKQALDDFKKKLTTSTTAGCNGQHTPPPSQYTPPPYHHNSSERPPSPLLPVSSNRIEHIINLLKQGIHIQPHVPHPTDKNLDWIQIKIPKQYYYYLIFSIRIYRNISIWRGKL